MMTYKDHVALVRLQIAAAMKYTLSGKWGEAPGKESLEEVERAARATASSLRPRTRAAAARHRRRGEPLDERCKQAERDYQNQRNQAKATRQPRVP